MSFLYEAYQRIIQENLLYSENVNVLYGLWHRGVINFFEKVVVAVFREYLLHIDGNELFIV